MNAHSCKLLGLSIAYVVNLLLFYGSIQCFLNIDRPNLPEMLFDLLVPLLLLAYLMGAIYLNRKIRNFRNRARIDIDLVLNDLILWHLKGILWAAIPAGSFGWMVAISHLNMGGSPVWVAILAIAGTTSDLLVIFSSRMAIDLAEIEIIAERSRR